MNRLIELLNFQPQLRVPLERRVSGNNFFGTGLGQTDQIVIKQAGDPKRRPAGLAQAEQLAGAPQLQVQFGQLKPILRRYQRLQPGSGFLIGARSQ